MCPSPPTPRTRAVLPGRSCASDSFAAWYDVSAASRQWRRATPDQARRRDEVPRRRDERDIPPGRRRAPSRRRGGRAGCARRRCRARWRIASRPRSPTGCRRRPDRRRDARRTRAERGDPPAVSWPSVNGSAYGYAPGGLLMMWMSERHSPAARHLDEHLRATRLRHRNLGDDRVGLPLVRRTARIVVALTKAAPGLD